MKSSLFEFNYTFAGLVDVGKKRSSNQDEIVLLPEHGFFAVSDGMGGLSNGADASHYVHDALPLLIQADAEDYRQKPEDDFAEYLLKSTAEMLSDQLFEKVNSPKRIRFGATLVGVWLLGNKAYFVCLGDSRGYLLPKYKTSIVQITEDMNIAGLMVRNGELTKEEARSDPGSSRLTAFVGMPAPATPEVYVTEVRPGDRILLCSDGLYGLMEEQELAKLLRSSRSPRRICQRLIDRANENGGTDNISAVYIRIC